MHETACYKEVSRIAGEFSEYLKCREIAASVDPESYRDYSAVIELPALNIRLRLWYSPKNKKARIVPSGNGEPELLRQISVHWHHYLNGGKTDLSGYHFYVDGSFIQGRIGYGVVIIKDGIVLTELSGALNRPDYVAHHQVGGELAAAVKSVEWCIKNKIDSCSIHYDYEGIRKWALGEWRANKELTKKYREYMQNIHLNIEWVKVKSHTGDVWNERADELAKGAIKTGRKNGRT